MHKSRPTYNILSFATMLNPNMDMCVSTSWACYTYMCVCVVGYGVTDAITLFLNLDHFLYIFISVLNPQLHVCVCANGEVSYRHKAIILVFHICIFTFFHPLIHASYWNIKFRLNIFNFLCHAVAEIVLLCTYVVNFYPLQIWVH